MYALGSRRHTVDTLEDRIEAVLDRVLEQEIRAGRFCLTDRGLGIFYADGEGGTCVLSVKDVARIAARTAQGWPAFSEHAAGQQVNDKPGQPGQGEESA